MHVCLFDIDGTLINSGGAGYVAMEAALASEFGVSVPTRGVSAAGRTDRAITRDLFAYHKIEDTPENTENFLAAYLVHLQAALPARKGRVLAGVVEVLEQLAVRDDVALGLLTGNIREGARHKLSHYRLYHHFPFGGFGDLHTDRNDVAREAYAEVTRIANGRIDHDRLWVIGDTPFDVQCGRAIGARVIAVATGTHSLEQLAPSEPDHLLADFSDPLSVLALFE